MLKCNYEPGCTQTRKIVALEPMPLPLSTDRTPGPQPNNFHTFNYTTFRNFDIGDIA